MEALEVLRFFFGLLLVLFIPGFTLTLALWPKTKSEVYREIADALKKNGISSACVVGGEEAEELLCSLRENSISAEICKGDVKENAVILADNLNNTAIPKSKLIIDLANNDAAAIKIEDTIDSIERVALSFGLSIAIAPLIGLILDKTYGIRLQSILASLILVIVLFLGIYVYRRKKWTTNKLS